VTSGEYIPHAPHPGLREGVIAMTAWREHSDEPLSRREVAHDAVTLILNLGPRLMVGGRHEPLRPMGSFVAAMNGHYGLTEFTGESSGIQVDMTPAFAHRLLRVPMSDLAPVVVAVDDVLGVWGTRLVERLGNTDETQTQFALLERELLTRLAGAPPTAPDVDFAWRRLQASDGAVPIATLVRELGCSGRHLSARFREQIGVGPKASGRIIRFRRAVELLSADDGGRYAEIAAGCGYSDQPHMNREFRALAGCSPLTLVGSRMSAVPGYAQDEQVSFVQAAAPAAA